MQHLSPSRLAQITSRHTRLQPEYRLTAASLLAALIGVAAAKCTMRAPVAAIRRKYFQPAAIYTVVSTLLVHQHERLRAASKYKELLTTASQHQNGIICHCLCMCV